MGRPIKLITSFFYLGHSPFAPGTAGSLAGLLVYFLVHRSVLLFSFSILFLFALGMLFSGEAEKVYKRKDARMIVIDEACGMLVALFLVPCRLLTVVIGFILFRVFDILKPPPAKSIEARSGAFGVMFDDLIAAVYTNAILQISSRMLHIF